MLFVENKNSVGPYRNSKQCGIRLKDDINVQQDSKRVYIQEVSII